MSLGEMQPPDMFNDHEAARAAAGEAGELVEFDTHSLELVRFRERRSWAYVNGAGENADVLVKIEPDADGTLLGKRQESVSLARDLHAVGAPIENHLIEPKQIAIERSAGGIALYVATITEYLPGSFNPKEDNYRPCGEGLALFHTFGEQFAGRFPGFGPLHPTHDTYRKLLELQEREALPQVGDIRLDEKLVNRLGTMLVDGEADVQELVACNAAEGNPSALLHGDLTPYNGRMDQHNKGVLIDLDHVSTGPWAYDFGRHMEGFRFGRSDKNIRTLLDGYAAHASWPVRPYMLELAARIAHVRFATSPLRRVADVALSGLKPDEYLLTEGIRRLSGAERWHSEEAYIAAAAQRRRNV